jgi:putative ABC transport system permease protein
VFLLLIMACVNVANLLLAGGQVRQGEFAVRRALGASRLRLARLLLVESVVLALAGGAGGLFIAWSALHVFTALDPGAQLQTRLEAIRLDGVIVGYALAIALLTAAAFGVVPALRGSAASPRTSLQEMGSRTASRNRGWPRAFIAVEVALSLILLIAAGLVGRAFLQMRLADPGFAADRVLGIRLALPDGRYQTPARQAAFFDDLLARAARLPGVTAASLGYGAMPPSDFMAHGDFETADRRERAPDVWISVSFVSPGHFELMGIPLVAGTGIEAHHLRSRDAAAEIPVVISSSLRRRFWRDRDPIADGFHLTDSRGTRRYRILGVAGDASGRGLASPACADCQWQIYAPLPGTRQWTEVLLRLADGAPPPVAGLRAAIGQIDPGVPSDDSLETAAASLHRFIGLPRFRAALFGGFAALAVTLTALGLLAVVFHSVKQRTREIGIRVALGARPSQVRRLVLAQGIPPTIIGLGAGMVVAAFLTQTMASFLLGIGPTDAFVFIGSAALLAVVALGATLGPVLRATRVNPVQALRSE